MQCFFGVRKGVPLQTKRDTRHLTVSLALCYNKQVGFFRREGGDCIVILHYFTFHFCWSGDCVVRTSQMAEQEVSPT